MGLFHYEYARNIFVLKGTVAQSSEACSTLPPCPSAQRPVALRSPPCSASLTFFSFLLLRRMHHLTGSGPALSVWRSGRFLSPPSPLASCGVINSQTYAGAWHRPLCSLHWFFSLASGDETFIFWQPNIPTDECKPHRSEQRLADPGCIWC